MWHKWHSTQFKIQTVALSGPGIWSSYASEWNTHQSKGQRGASTRSFPRLALSQHAPWEWLMRNNIQTHSSSTQAKCKMNAAKWKRISALNDQRNRRGPQFTRHFFSSLLLCCSIELLMIKADYGTIITLAVVRSIQVPPGFRMMILKATVRGNQFLLRRFCCLKCHIDISYTS